jgi:septal ring factor EnvC (AmiA/AmiB activator)
MLALLGGYRWTIAAAVLALAGIYVAQLHARLALCSSRVTAREKTIEQRDETIREKIRLLEARDAAIREQNAAVVALRAESDQAAKRAAAALAQARKASDRSRQEIADLTARINAGAGKTCADAVGEIRGHL